ncbi:MAG: toll/interleukin-1 receptor domain-containing protein [Capsulimonadaceae bacterium]
MQVFISHSVNDNDFVRSLSSHLEQNGLKVWTDNEILPGDNWAHQIAKALDDSEAMVVVLTPQSRKSPWQSREIEFALGQHAYKGRLISVLTEDTSPEEIPWILRTLNVLRIGGPDDIERGADQIAEILRKAA